MTTHQVKGNMQRQIKRAYQDVAELFSGQAKETLLYENEGKHLYELERITGLCPNCARILDLGGGMGINLLVLSRLGLGYDLHLIDRFAEYDENNRMGSAERGLRLLKDSGITVVNQDFWAKPKQPYDDEFFDVVTCLDVIEHLPGHPLGLLREVRRVLNADGVLILAVPNASSLVKRIMLLFGKHPYMPFGLWCQEGYFSHYREYTPGECAMLLEKSGFHDVKIETVTEPSKTRARHNFWRTHQRGYSPRSVMVRVGLKAKCLIESFLPGFRPQVYGFARSRRKLEGHKQPQ